jgi:hypothetical protein
MKATLSPLPYTKTRVETQTTVLDWVQAAEEFYVSYVKVNEILQKRTFTVHASSTSCKTARASGRTTKLIQLQQYMKDVLVTLLLDIDRSTVMPFGGDSTKPSKVGQLATHAQLIKEVNQKISKELLYLTAAQA